MTTYPSKDRTGFLGGSDAAAVLGVSPWRSRYSLWCEKKGAEAPPSLLDNDYVLLGNLLEPIVANLFCERAEKKVQVMTAPVIHKKYPFLRGHVDRKVIKENACLECKTTNAFDYRDWLPNSDGGDGCKLIPRHYLAQLDHYMMCGSYSFSYIAVLIGGNTFRWYRVERDAKREKTLLQACLEFWERFVLGDEVPEIGNEADARHRWKTTIEGSSVKVGDRDRKAVLSLSSVQSQLKELREQERNLRDQLVPLFEDKEFLVHDGEVICRFYSGTRESVDIKAIKKLNLKSVQKFISRNPVRYLKVMV